MCGQNWFLIIEGDVLMMNRERGLHFQQRARIVKWWRKRAAEMAEEMGMPKDLNRIRVASRVRKPDRAALPDLAGEFPTLKAAIDGLVDHGVIPDDDAHHLDALIFYPPHVERGVPVALEMRVACVGAHREPVD